MKLLTIGLLALTLAINAFAEESKICHITSDADSENTQLLIETNSDGDLDSIRLYKTMDSKVVSDETHPAERVISDGVVASQRDGRPIIVLRPKNFNSVTGGIFTLDHIFNGITGARKDFNLKLVRGEGAFYLTTMEGARVNRLFIVANKVLGKVIGIKEIRPSFK
jgi:hypothetical protein